MQQKKTTILVLSWRDIKSPQMGGAEIFTHEMMRNSDLHKYSFIHLSPMFGGAEEYEDIDGITYMRRGSLKTLIFECMKYYRKNKDCIDFVIDQCNTFRFFTKFWVKADKRIFLIYQLTREIWDISSAFPVSKIGMLMETSMLRLNKNGITLTISESTKQDLLNVGFYESKITILPAGIDFVPWNKSDFYDKQTDPTFIYVGRFAKYKGIDACFSAFGRIKNKLNNARLWIVGKKDESYITSSLLPICTQYGLTYGGPDDGCDVTFHGFVTAEKKLELMSRAHLLLMPSIREGWGLIITEAAAVGTPSVVFNSPGIVDAVDFGRAGYIVKENSHDGLYEVMVSATECKDDYAEIRKKAHDFSRRFNWKNTGAAFTDFITSLQ